MTALDEGTAKILKALQADAEAGRARFFNRELSWVAFNLRVLEEAEDIGNPIGERARFLAITVSNLDEFTMVRVAALHRLQGSVQCDPAGLTPAQQLAALRTAIHALVDQCYACWRESLLPALDLAGWHLVAAPEWTADDTESLSVYFRHQLAPVLTPLAVDQSRPFPLLAGGAIHLAVRLLPPSTEPNQDPRHALVALPAGRRLLPLPAGGPGRFALAEEVLERWLAGLFPGYTIAGKAQFRLTRDGDLQIAEAEATDLLEEIEEELRTRGQGHPVRLEFRTGGDGELRAWLLERLDLDPVDLFEIDGPLDLTVLHAVPDFFADPTTRYASFAPRLPSTDWGDPFPAMRSGADILTHHPFDSFAFVVQLLEAAANDPAVLAIKQTLYRVSGDSPLVRALIRAARAGKQVTVLVELRARFDEEANIRWARRLEEAGAHVIYGLVGYKVHAKLLLIIRRDEDGLRRYCHLGTGNYNDKTARLYTDLGFFTINEAVGRDVSALFNVLTGFAVPPVWERLSVAPTTMRTDFVAWIRREADHARAGRGGRIIAKFNSLVDIGICAELYAASAAGVEIDLIVRGMCVLRPGVALLSESIRVRSIVGRFLEHSRIYHFGNAGKPVWAIASADWMDRNLNRRVESLVRIEDPALQGKLAEIMRIYLDDTWSARVLEVDGGYRRLRVDPATASQQVLLRSVQAAAAQAEDLSGPAKALRPLRKPRRRGA